MASTKTGVSDTSWFVYNSNFQRAKVSMKITFTWSQVRKLEWNNNLTSAETFWKYRKGIC